MAVSGVRHTLFFQMLSIIYILRLSRLLSGFFFAQLSLCHLIAQPTFQKTFGEALEDVGRSIQPTADSGYIITGFTSNFGEGGTDVYLIKTNANGDTLWTKTYGGTLTDVGYSVQQVTDGGYIITGYTASFGTGIWNVYLLKTDPTGSLQWSKTFGGVDFSRAESVQQTTDGGYIITGFTDSYGAGDLDVYLLKVDSSGALQWSKTFGGPNADYGYSVQQTTDGGYIIAGYTRTNSIVTSTDIYLIKTSANGDTLWTKAYGGFGTDVGYSVQQTTDGGYIITGRTFSIGAGDADGYLLKTDSIGAWQWIKTYGGASFDEGRFVQQTPDGGYIIIGRTTSFGTGDDDVYLLKTDSTGVLQWSKTFGGAGNDIGWAVQPTIDGGYVITGYTNSFGITGFDHLYLIKTDSNGNSLCTQFQLPVNTLVSDTFIVVIPVATTIGSGAISNNTATVVSSTATIDSLLCYPCDTPAAAFSYTDSLLTVSFSDSSTDAVSWLWNFGNGDTSFLQHPVYTYTIGGTYNICLIVNNSCGSDSTCDSIDVITTGFSELSLFGADLNIYPNPNTGQFTLKINLQEKTHLSVNLYKVNGQLIYTNDSPNFTVSRPLGKGLVNLFIDLSNHSKGIYYVQILTDKGVLTKKVIYQ
ncbi:MAG: T9SS type A sorting domain-containing protein [Cytophagales bacterium]|nr:T9SS type A sorting domain-containing protein [Cytophagales bacterium]